MTNSSVNLPEKYWDQFRLSNDDLEFLYNHLLEIETPLTPEELVRAVVVERIQVEKKKLETLPKQGVEKYKPANHYEPDQDLVFTGGTNQTGKVLSVRAGNNPEIGTFEVIAVRFEDGAEKQFAAGLADHRLNQIADEVKEEDPALNPDWVMEHFGAGLEESIGQELETNPDLVRIAGKWFPSALLVDINIGFLNLAEAVLEMAGGGPLSTCEIIDQIELPADSNQNLTEFSFNRALQEDGRFDEVGPSGEVLWFLRRLEPDAIQNTPALLKHNTFTYDHNAIQPLKELLRGKVADEIEPEFSSGFGKSNEVAISLIFPHWRSGTLPLVGQIRKLFPTAMESFRVQFTFVDGNSGKKFPGWVNVPERYAYGLKEWYEEQGVFPGCIIHIQRGAQPGEVTVRVEKRRVAKDWVRTALVGADGGVVFALLKQPVPATFDERMGVVVPDAAAVEKIWDLSNRQKGTLEHTVQTTMRELAKINPQGQVHALELYSAVNITRRCPPGIILSLLAEGNWATYLGDLYFRLNDGDLEANDDE